MRFVFIDQQLQFISVKIALAPAHIHTSALCCLGPLLSLLILSGCLSLFRPSGLRASAPGPASPNRVQFPAHVQSGWWPTTRSRVGRDVVLVASLKPSVEVSEGLPGGKPR